MIICFQKSKLEKIFNSERHLQKEFGNEQANKIKLRLKVLQAAVNLAEVPVSKPDRCHQLTGDRKGDFAVDLKQPFRLIFRPVEPVPYLETGEIDLTKVTGIIILGVENYHDS